MVSPGTARQRLKKAIEQQAFVRSTDEQIVSRRGTENSNWLFDIRAIQMQSSVMADISALFWDSFAGRRIQVGCIESAGIALASNLIATAKNHGIPDCSGFFIRKSRKKDGLLKMIEGTMNDADIVLVDDVMNSGKSFLKQIEVLKAEGKKVSAVWCLVRFRDMDFYEYLHVEGIKIHSVFELNDFSSTLETANLLTRELPKMTQAFDVIWKFGSPSPSYFHIVPKSEPALYGANLYVGSDNGTFRCLRQSDGKEVWSFKTGFHPHKKGIFSSPVVHDGTVYFGAYDGNVYALDAASGEKKWVCFDADWVGSSPAIAPELETVFVGLEFGLWRRRGGIIALNTKTGASKWQYEMPCYTHSSPLYIPSRKQVVIGSNDGAVYVFDARSGALQWKYESGPRSEETHNSGYGAYDIKESFAYDEARDIIIFGNMHGDITAIDRASGTKKAFFQAEFGVYSTPLIVSDSIFVTSLDHNLYCLDIDTLDEKWRWYAGARVFATPAFIEGSVYVGANTGRLTELNPDTGKVTSSFTVPERITNRVVYNEMSQTFFLSTVANEIYCIKKPPYK
jgi:outer membrane protein assembly factor BamB/orotate phosphoribosyltransferase-like protein